MSSPGWFIDRQLKPPRQSYIPQANLASCYSDLPTTVTDVNQKHTSIPVTPLQHRMAARKRAVRNSSGVVDSPSQSNFCQPDVPEETFPSHPAIAVRCPSIAIKLLSTPEPQRPYSTASTAPETEKVQNPHAPRASEPVSPVRV